MKSKKKASILRTLLFRCLLLLLYFQCVMFGALKQIQAEESLDLLIQELTSPQRSERVNAEKLLISRGEAALLEIEKAIKLNSDASFHLQKIANRIRNQIASDALSGTSITIGGNDSSTLQQVVNEIAEQTGFQLRVDESVKQIPVTFMNEKVPFWKGIDILGDLADIGWQVQNNEQTGNNEIAFDPKFQLRYGAAAYSKSLRVAAVHSRLKQNFRNRTDRGLIRINFRIDLEPGITPYYLIIRDQEFRLIDSTSSPMILIPPFNTDAVREITLGNQSGFQFYVDFVSDEEIDTDLLTLNGKVAILCAAQRDELKISLSDLNQVDSRVAIMNVEQSDGQLKLITRIQLPEQLASFDSHRITLLHKDAWLSSKGEQRITPLSKRIITTEGDSQTVEFLFKYDQGITPEVQFIYGYPNYVSTLRTDFEIEELSFTSSP